MSMQRRTFLSLLALPAVAQLLQSCGDEAADEPSTTPTAPTVPADGAGHSSLKGSAPLVATTPDDALAGSAAINAFSADLYERLVAADPTANVVFSPASIALALAMTSAGAKGATLQEMNTVLHITEPGTIHRSMNALGTALQTLNQVRDNTAEGGTGTSEVQLSIANSLWGQSGLAFEQAFLDLLSAEYDAGLELVDYATDPEAARAAINGWVAQQTNDRIPELLVEGTITPDARLTLVNAIYLKANWATTFDAEQTTDQPFATPAGDVSAAMMHASADFGYAAGQGWQAVDLPYVFGGLSFTAALVEADAPLPSADEVFAALAGRPVQLSFPRFDIETSVELSRVLEAMGMPTAFSGAADFSGMTTAASLTIGAVVHQANITVDEEGTEAAAATAVVMVETAAPEPQEPIVLTFDRPFTFWLRDRGSGTVLFAGRVADPGSTRS